MMKSYSRVSEQLWPIKPIKNASAEISVGTVQRLPGGEQASYERRFEQVIGSSPALESVLEQVERVAPTDSTVLIQGETGHRQGVSHTRSITSARVAGVLRALNCAPFRSICSKVNFLATKEVRSQSHRAKDWGRFELLTKHAVG